MSNRSHYADLKKIILLLGLGIAIYCGRPNSKWAGSVLTQNGITYIDNPERPYVSTPVFELTHEAVFGKQESISRMRYDVGNSGDIYVLDPDERKVTIFDAEGGVKGSFGRRGQGPGELDTLGTIRATPNGDIVIADAGGGLKYYSPQGKYLKRVSDTNLGAALISMKIAMNGDMLILLSYNPWTWEIRRCDDRLNSTATITKKETTPGISNQIDLFVPSLEFASDSRSRLYWGSSDEFSIDIADPENKRVGRITKAFSNRPFPDYEKRRLTAEMRIRAYFPRNIKIIWPPRCPAFDTFWIDDEDRLYVLVYGADDLDKIEVFNKSGQYWGDARLPHRMGDILVKKGRLYAIDETDEGYRVLKRYDMDGKNVIPESWTPR